MFQDNEKGQMLEYRVNPYSKLFSRFMCKCNQTSSTTSKEQSQKVLTRTKVLKAPDLNASGKGIYVK